MWSASTQAVSQKLSRKYIWIEFWNQFEDFDIPRLKDVIAGKITWISKEKWANYKWGWFFKYLYLNQYDDWFSDEWYLKLLESDINSLENLKVEDNKISDLLIKLSDIKEKIYKADDNL